MLDIVELQHIEDLEQYRADWQRLLVQTPAANFFQTLDWLKVYWKHRRDGQKLRVMIAQSQGQVVGIVPMVERFEQTRAGRIRVLTFPLDGWGSYYEPIGPLRDDTLEAVLAHIKRTPRTWDTIELPWLRPELVEQGWPQRTLNKQGLKAEPFELESTSVISLDTSWEEYLASRGTKWRNNFRRWQRRLEERGPVEHVRYRPLGEQSSETDPRWDLYDACESVAARSWQAIDNSTVGTTLCHASVRPLLRDVHEVAARTGHLDLNLLYIAGTPVAFAYNYYRAGSIFGLRVGYDAALAHDGAGNVLYARIIRDSIQRRDRLYDLGPGSLEAKKHLWTAVEPVLGYRYYAPLAWRSQLVRLKRRIFTLQSRRVKSTGLTASWQPISSPGKFVRGFTL